MHKPGNVSYAVIISGVWAFDANDEKSLPFLKTSFHISCAIFRNYYIATGFDNISRSGRYINPKYKKVGMKINVN